MAPFTETQRFNQWWLMAIFAIVLFETLATILYDYQSKGLVENSSLISFGIACIATLIILGMYLKTSIDENGVHYLFFPFWPKQKRITWSEIETAYIRRYKPLLEYGGWGIKGLFKKNMAISTRGNIGLQLELKGGKKILIGTNQQQKLEHYLQYIKTKHSITAIQ